MSNLVLYTQVTLILINVHVRHHVYCKGFYVVSRVEERSTSGRNVSVVRLEEKTLYTDLYIFLLSLHLPVYQLLATLCLDLYG